MICGIPHWLSYKGKIVKGGRTIVRVGLFSSKGRELDKYIDLFNIIKNIIKVKSSY